jgi:hypothetical protein
MMNLTGGIAMVCLAVVMIWFGMPSDGVSHRFFKGPWIVGQVYVMAAMMLFVMGGAAIISSM